MAEHFPEVNASNLESRKFTLPQDFEGERNLLFIAFQREQQKNIDTWLHEVKRFEELDSKLHYYEIPTISRLNPLSRWFIDNGMRLGIPDKRARERTITLYLDKDPFEKSLKIPTEKTIYIFLVIEPAESYGAQKATSTKRRLKVFARCCSSIMRCRSEHDVYDRLRARVRQRCSRIVHRTASDIWGLI